MSLKSYACATKRNVHCHVFHCFASFRGFTSSAPPLFRKKVSLRLAGGYASIAAEMALVRAIRSKALLEAAVPEAVVGVPDGA